MRVHSCSRRGWFSCALSVVVTVLFHSTGVQAAPPLAPGAVTQPTPASAKPAEPAPCPTTREGYSALVTRVEASYEARAEKEFLADAARLSACFPALEEPLSGSVAAHDLRARAYIFFAARDFDAVEAALLASLDLEPDARVPTAIAPRAGHPMFDAQQRALDRVAHRAEPVLLPPLPRLSLTINGVSSDSYQPDELTVLQLTSPMTGVIYNRVLKPGEVFTPEDVPGLPLVQRQIARQVRLSERVWIAGGVALALSGGATLYSHVAARSLDEASPDEVGSALDRVSAGRAVATGLAGTGLTLGVTGAVIRW